MLSGPSLYAALLTWSAPEVRADTGWTDKSDVYSMGHLLFRLLTGKVPTKGADPPSDPGSSGSPCPDELASAIMRALRVDPKGRPSAAEFAELLEEALEAQVHAHVLAMATPAGRPALRLVPTGPQRPTDWTEHPIPEADSEPLIPAVLAQPPAPSVRARHRWPWTAAIGVMALGLGWWLKNTMAPRTREQAALAASPRVAPHDPIVPASAPATPPSATPALPSVRDVLATTAPALRRCAEHTGGLLIVQFTTVAGRETFDTVSVSGLTSPTVDGCIRDATAGVRFQPQGAESFTREYMP